MIRVVLVDDHTLVRRGIRGLLELDAGISVVGEAADGDEAATLIRAMRPHVVLLDLIMPKRNGLDLLRDLQATQELPPTIVLTTFDDDEGLFLALKAGARGYLLKDVSVEQLATAVHQVASGGHVVRPAVTERTLAGLARLRPTFDHLDPEDVLTKREVEVLRLMAGGYSNREIAEALGTAEATVKTQASAILSKLGVRDRTRAVLRGIERGLI